ncbi:MAG: ABC transporter permease [Firmicutes bacterium]|nr:ABC transporter permease [Bacillota bacterium]
MQARLAREEQLRRMVETNTQARHRHKRLTFFWARTGLLLSFLLLWELLSGRVIDSFFISSPLKIGASFEELFQGGKVFLHFATTLNEVLLGFTAGVLGALIGAVLVIIFRDAYDVVEPFFIALYGIPRIALAPLLIMWLGLGIKSKIFLSGLLVFFVVFMTVVAGIRMVDEGVINSARLMGGSRSQIIRTVILPASYPYFVAGLRMGVPMAIIGAIVGEFISANRGIGFLIQWASSAFNTSLAFAAIFLLLILVVGLNFAVNKADAHLLKWRPKNSEERITTTM